MARHVSTDQIVSYLKTAKRISVDGVIFKDTDISFKDDSIVIEQYTFPLNYFDIAGIDPNSFILVDDKHEWRRVQCHDTKNKTLKHPEWDHEDYDFGKVKNTDVLAIANQTKFDK